MRRIKSDTERVQLRERCESSLFRRLTRDLQLIIIQFVPQTAKVQLCCVSRAMRMLVRDAGVPQLIRFADLLSRDNSPTVSTFYPADGRAPQSERYWMRKIASGIFSSVTSLSFSACTISSSMVNQAISSCALLLTLDLSLTNLDDSLLLEIDIANVPCWLFNHCGLLRFECPLLLQKLAHVSWESLSIAHCVAIAPTQFKYLLGDRLKALDVTGCAIGSIEIAVPNFLPLERIVVSCTAFTDSSLRLLLVMCPALRSLDVSRCDQLTELGLFDILRSVSDNLAEFSFSGCQFRGNLIFSPVASYPNLRRVDGSNSGLDASAAVSAFSLPSLVELNISNCQLARRESFRDATFMRLLRDNRRKISKSTALYFGLERR